jgi:geranylgeranyl pyrophosphate synthase
MLVGDVALCLAHYYALDSHFETKNKISALSSFIDNLVVTGLGQVMDLQLSVNNGHVTPAEIIGMTEYKTAYYTVVAPMQLGALLADCSDLLLNNIAGFGSPLGIAFQLKDDILGLYGDEKQIGKPNLSDLCEGKQTLLMKFGADRTKGKDRAFLLPRMAGE